MITRLLGLLFAVAALAATETHTVVLPAQFTDFTNTFSLPQFDPAVGTITSATLSVAATGTSQTSVENLDAIPWDVISGSSVNFNLSGLVTGSVENTFTNSLAAFDGVDDFGGTSGIVNTAISTTSTLSAALVPASCLGTGSFSFYFSAGGISIFEGPGSNIFRVRTKASAVVSIVYTFDPDCPVAPAPKPVCSPKPFYCFPAPKGYGCRKP